MLCVDISHDGELKKVIGLAVHIRAHIEDDGGSFERGHERGDGRSLDPSSLPSTKRDVAMAAPVCPALITATASLLFTSSLATRMDESFFLRKTVAGESSMSTTSVAFRTSIGSDCACGCFLSSA